MDQSLITPHANDITLEIRGQTFQLLPERAVFWAEEKTLLVSDLHWGKTEIFHHFGAAIPDGVLRDDLWRLSQAISRVQAKRLLILGDLVHSPRTLQAHVRQLIAEWRVQNDSINVELILGNHDRGLKIDPEWKMTVHPRAIQERDFVFTHDAQAITPSTFTWSGHLHPVFRVSSATDSLRLPCFEIQKNLGFLPAFSAFTGGAEVRSMSSKIYVIAENHVVQVQ